MLGLLNQGRYEHCRRCGRRIFAGESCASCEAHDRGRYARPRRTGEPQQNLSIARCPGLSAGQAHLVLARAIGPNGLCRRCGPPPTPEPAPVASGAVPTLPDAMLPQAPKDPPAHEVPAAVAKPGVVRQGPPQTTCGPRQDPRGLAVIRVPCLVCGRRFVPTSRNGGTQRYCGKHCKQRAKNARQRAESARKPAENRASCAQDARFVDRRQEQSRPGGRAATQANTPVSEAIDLPDVPDGGVSKGTSHAADPPRARGEDPRRTWKALQVRITPALYAWISRAAILRRENVGQVVERGLRSSMRKLLRDWPSEYLEDLPTLARRRSIP